LAHASAKILYRTDRVFLESKRHTSELRLNGHKHTYRLASHVHPDAVAGENRNIKMFGHEFRDCRALHRCL
jgi:hypothetical protein